MIEIMVKVACALALLGFGHHVDKAPGDAMPVSQGVVASPSPTPVVSAPVPVVSSPVSGCLTASEVAGYARRAGFTEAEVPQMVAYAYRESHYCPGAVNGGGAAWAGGPACGIWQLFKCPGPSSLDPMVNAWQAREKCLADVAAGFSCFRPWGG